MLGQVDPEEMLAGMTEKTYQQWVRFFAEEPFGPQVETLMLANVAASMSGSDPANFLPITVEVSPEDVE